MDSDCVEWDLVQSVAMVDTHCRYFDSGKSTAWVTTVNLDDEIDSTMHTVFPSVPMYCMAGFSFGCDMLMPN